MTEISEVVISSLKSEYLSILILIVAWILINAAAIWFADKKKLGFGIAVIFAYVRFFGTIAAVVILCVIRPIWILVRDRSEFLNVKPVILCVLCITALLLPAVISVFVLLFGKKIMERREYRREHEGKDMYTVEPADYKSAGDFKRELDARGLFYSDDYKPLLMQINGRYQDFSRGVYGFNFFPPATITTLRSEEYEDAEIVAGIDVADNITTNGYPVFTDIDACDVEADVVMDVPVVEFDTGGRWNTDKQHLAPALDELISGGVRCRATGIHQRRAVVLVVVTGDHQIHIQLFHYRTKEIPEIVDRAVNAVVAVGAHGIMDHHNRPVVRLRLLRCGAQKVRVAQVIGIADVHADGDVLAIVTIVTERYRSQYALIYTTRLQEAVTDKQILPEERIAYNNPSVSMSTEDMAKYARSIWNSSARIRNVSTKQHRMTMRLNNIYSVGEYFFIDFSIENRTNIRFDIDELRVKLSDKKQSKATNAQMIELAPAFVLDQSQTFKYGYRNVVVLKKMTFPNDKVLSIELSEKQISGRAITLNIDYEDVLYADSFNSLLLKEE